MDTTASQVSLKNCLPEKHFFLVAEDSSIGRKSLQSILHNLGVKNIVYAEDGKEAWRKLEQDYRITLVICDWQMPGMSGLELLKKVRGSKRIAKLPFIMVTGDGTKEAVLEAVQAGVSNYVVKPVTADTLETKLVQVFANKS